MTKCCDDFGYCARTTAICMTIAGIILQIIAALECEYLKFKDALLVGSGTIGLFELSSSVGTGGSCVKYDEVGIDDPDNYVKTTRVTLILSMCFAAAAFLVVLIEFTCCRIPCAGGLEGCLYMLAYVLGATAFTMFGSDFCTNGAFASCELGSGAIYNIAAVCLYFVSSCIVCCLPKSPGLLCNRKKDNDGGHDDDDAPVDAKGYDDAGEDGKGAEP